MNVTFAKVKVNISILLTMDYGPSVKPVWNWSMVNAILRNIVFTNHVSVRKNESRS